MTESLAVTMQPRTVDALPEWLSEYGLAEAFGFTVSWLRYDRSHNGANAIPFIKVSRRIWYHAPTVQQFFLTQCSHGAPIRDADEAR
jgi:hypothetical protein